MSDLIHPTYRYLDRAIRVAGLTVAQWIALLLAGIIAYLLAAVLPFSSTYNASIAVTIAGTPIAVALALGTNRGNPFRLVTDVVRWRCTRALYRAAESGAPEQPASPAGRARRAGAASCGPRRR
jgi:hypothetical protein